MSGVPVTPIDVDPPRIVTRAVILAASPGTTLLPIANFCPKPELPVANEPLLDHLTRLFRRWGITDAAIVCGRHAESPGFRSFVPATTDPASAGPRLQAFTERGPVGTAGALRDLSPFVDHSPAVVVDAGVISADVDMDDLIQLHLDRRTDVTIVVDAARNGLHREHVTITPTGQVAAMHVRFDAPAADSCVAPAGIYLISPEALDLIPSEGHFDLKEQLIPLLIANGRSVYAYAGHVRSIRTMDDYVQANRDVLCNGLAKRARQRPGLSEIAQGVWAEPGAVVSPDAELVGPMIVGRDAMIGDGATVIGPTVIGDASRIAPGAVVHESILWHSVQIGERAEVRASVLGHQSVVPPGTHVSNALVMDSAACNGGARFLRLVAPDPAGVLIHHKGKLVGHGWRGNLKHTAYLASKRAIDVVVSTAALLATLPFLAVIAIIIKADSPGPVFFGQKRTGRGGRAFTMIKLRTMTIDADRREAELRSRSDVDGPVFKMANDPRVTRVGRVLRRFRLDELPQFVNVLKGEMSLVGPRPLVIEEMRHAPGWRDIRLKVKPGITGLWQIRCRDRLMFQDWIVHDIDYVKRQSLLLDAQILIKTVGVVLHGTGAS